MANNMPGWAMALGGLIEGPKAVSNVMSMVRDINDFRANSNTSESLQQLGKFTTGADAMQYQPEGYMTADQRLKLEEIKKQKAAELYAREASPYQAEASRLSRMAANDPYIGSAEGLADFAQRPEFWLGADNSGTIAGGKGKAPSTAAGANPYTAQIVQDFGNQNQNILDAFRAGNQDPMALARVAQNKDLANAFQNVQQANNYLNTDARKRQEDALKETNRAKDEKNLRDFASSVSMLTTPSERTGKMMPFGEAAALVQQAAADYPVSDATLNNTVDNLLAQYKETRFPVAGKVGRTQYTGTQNLMGDINKDVSSVAPVTNVYNMERGDRKDEQALRKEFLSLPEVKDYPTMEAQIQRGLKALKEQGKNNVAVDQTVITVLNKMLDPSSVVRESEYARTPQDLAVLNRIKGKWEKIRTGGAGISGEDRQALVRMAQNFAAIASQQYNNRVEEYKALAKDYGYNPDRVVPRKNALDDRGMPQGQSAAPIAPAGTRIKTASGRVMTSDGKGGWR